MNIYHPLNWTNNSGQVSETVVEEMIINIYWVWFLTFEVDIYRNTELSKFTACHGAELTSKLRETPWHLQAIKAYVHSIQEYKRIQPFTRVNSIAMDSV